MFAAEHDNRYKNEITLEATHELVALGKQQILCRMFSFANCEFIDLLSSTQKPDKLHYFVINEFDACNMKSSSLWLLF